MFKPSHPRPIPLRSRTIKGRLIQTVAANRAAEVAALTNRINTAVTPLLADGVHSYRKGRSIHTAIQHIGMLPGHCMTFDIQRYFPSVSQARLERQLNKLDPSIWIDLAPLLGDQGLPTGTSFSPMLSNLYLNDLDHRFEWIRYCDNIMIVGANPQKLFKKAQRHLSDIGLTCHQIDIEPRSFCKQPLPLRSTEELVI